MNSKLNDFFSCLTLVAVVFIVLKLVGCIEWHWLWVVFPAIVVIVGIGLAVTKEEE